MSDNRPSKDEYNKQLLLVVKLRASCPRRQGAAIIVDEKGVHLSTGYNGPPSSLPNCTEDPCEGASDKSGDTSRCIALHAEHNAIKNAGDKIRWATTMYCTTLPCMKCALEICDTPIKRVVYIEHYPDERCLKFFEQSGITLEKF